MDLTGQLSNPQPALCQLADLDIDAPQDLVPEKVHVADAIPRSETRTARPLKPAQVDALIVGYEAGKTMKELATEFGIDRRTVSTHLRRTEIATRQGGLNQEQTIDAVHLYEAGWSSARLATGFDLSADNVLKALRQAGVAIRPRRGGPQRRGRTT